MAETLQAHKVLLECLFDQSDGLAGSTHFIKAFNCNNLWHEWFLTGDGLLGGKNRVGVTHTHTHTLYTVTNKDMAHHTLPVNCLEIFIVETMT